MKPELQSRLYNSRSNISSKSGLAYKKETGKWLSPEYPRDCQRLWKTCTAWSAASTWPDKAESTTSRSDKKDHLWFFSCIFTKDIPVFVVFGAHLPQIAAFNWLTSPKLVKHSHATLRLDTAAVKQYFSQIVKCSNMAVNVRISKLF